MLGHWRPIFLRFEKGGKMVPCGGVFFAVAPLVAVSAGIVWLVLFLLFRYASIASILAGIALPVFAVIYGDPLPVVIFGVGAAAGILFLHRATFAVCAQAPRAASTSGVRTRRALRPRTPYSGRRNHSRSSV